MIYMYILKLHSELDLAFVYVKLKEYGIRDWFMHAWKGFALTNIVIHNSIKSQAQDSIRAVQN